MPKILTKNHAIHKEFVIIHHGLHLDHARPPVVPVSKKEPSMTVMVRLFKLIANNATILFNILYGVNGVYVLHHAVAASKNDLEVIPVSVAKKKLQHVSLVIALTGKCGQCGHSAQPLVEKVQEQELGRVSMVLLVKIVVEILWNTQHV